MRYNYMALLDERGVEDPWEAPVEQLDLEGTLALLSFVHRASCWRDSAYSEAFQSGLMKRILLHIRELDTPAQTGEACPAGADVTIDLRWLSSLDRSTYSELAEWLAGKELLEGAYDELSSKDAKTHAHAVGDTVASVLASYRGVKEEEFVRILAEVARLAYDRALYEREKGLLTQGAAQSIFRTMEEARMDDEKTDWEEFESLIFASRKVKTAPFFF